MQIDLSSYEPKREEMLIPEWGDEPFYVREMLGRHLEMVQNYADVVKGKVIIKHQFALLIVCSLVDKDNKYIFTEKDIPYIENQPAVLVARIVAVVNRVSGVVLAMM